MNYRKFTKKEIPISVIGLGTWQFGGEWGQIFTQRDADQIIDCCRETGINLIDTAECYGDGLSERLVGQATTRDRENWFLSTKFGHRFTGMLDREQKWSATEVRKQLEQSLKNLQTDYIDLYQFHSGANEYFNNPALWEMLALQMEKGEIRQIGVSLTSRADYRDYQAPLVSNVGAEAVQVLYNRLDRGAEEIVFPCCLRNELGVLVRVPLASGFLSGKYSLDPVFPESDYRSSLGREKINGMIRESANVLRYEVPKQMKMSSWAINWCLNHPVVSCVIVGSRNCEQLRANAAAAVHSAASHPLAIKQQQPPEYSQKPN